jgi:hypothetical protein
VTRDDQVRRLALALPCAYEDTHRGHPSFRVEKRIFAMLRPTGPGLIVKLGSDDQHNMLEAYPETVVPSEHYTHHGWTRVVLGEADEALLALILRLAWLHVTPKRLHKLLG